MEPTGGIEPPTCGLRNRCSTAELRWLGHQFVLEIDVIEINSRPLAQLLATSWQHQLRVLSAKSLENRPAASFNSESHSELAWPRERRMRGAIITLGYLTNPHFSSADIHSARV